MKKIALAGTLLALAAGTASQSAETIKYTYDAKGRLIKVVHTGTVNNNLQTDYTHDKTDNRTSMIRTKPP